MHTEKRIISRKKLGMLTATIALIVALTEGVLSLVRTRVILFAFGDETNAIMQVAVQITAYLVLIESGMTAAYQLKLYQPLSENNLTRTSSLFWGLRKNMRTIVTKMFVVVNICSFIYVFFFLNVKDNRIQAFLIFFVMGIRFVSPYLFTIQERTILIASEKGYVTNIIQGILQCGTLVTEILLCKYTKLPLIVILFSYVIGVLLAKLVYLFYRKKILHLKFELNVEPDLEPTNMTKDILAHQISGMISANTDNILLSIMSSLTNVTIYSAFSTVMNFPITLFNSIISSMKASVIIKIQNRENGTFELYENVLNLSCMIMAFVTSIFVAQIDKFVKLWIGQKYILDNICIVMFSFILFTQVVLNVLTIGIDAKGLYKETKKYAVAQAMANLGLTLILIPFWGIKGALLGTVASVILVKIPFMSGVVYKDVFNEKNHFYAILGSGYICTLITALLNNMISRLWTSTNWKIFILSTIVCSLNSLLIIFLWYWITNRKMIKYFSRGILKT